MLTTYSFKLRRSRRLDRVASAGSPTPEEFNVILVLEHRSEPRGPLPVDGLAKVRNDLRSEETPIAPMLLSPEPALRKCSPRACLRRLGVYLPPRKRRLPLPATPPTSSISSPP